MFNESAYDPVRWSREINWEIFKVIEEQLKMTTVTRRSFSMSFNKMYFVGHCKKCDISFSSKTELEDHILAKHGRYICPLCSKLHSRNRVEHFVRSNGNYYCDRCQAGFVYVEY